MSNEIYIVTLEKKVQSVSPKTEVKQIIPYIDDVIQSTSHRAEWNRPEIFCYTDRNLLREVLKKHLYAEIGKEYSDDSIEKVIESEGIILDDLSQIRIQNTFTNLSFLSYDHWYSWEMDRNVIHLELKVEDEEEYTFEELMNKIKGDIDQRLRGMVLERILEQIQHEKVSEEFKKRRVKWNLAGGCKFIHYKKPADMSGPKRASIKKVIERFNKAKEEMVDSLCGVVINEMNDEKYEKLRETFGERLEEIICGRILQFFEDRSPGDLIETLLEVL